MSGFWWTWGPGEQDAPVETPTVFSNAPSLWSGGVRWGDTAGPFDDGTDAYWGNVNAAVGRTGAPRLSVAIDGRLVLEQLRSANWTLGRRDWLSTLTPTSASFEFNDEPIVAINDTIVVGLMSDVAESHSDALWSGRVASFGTREEITGFTFTNISATDIIGILGQADAPATISAGHNLVSLVELLASNAGLDVEVDKDPLVTLPTLSAAGSSTDPIGGNVIDLINRAERSSNALLFLRGNGRLYAAMRNTTGASAVQVLDLDGEDSTTVWATETSVDSVVTRWKLGGTGDWSSDTQATTFDEYGDHTFSAEDLLIVDPAPYAPLIASDVMAHPRPIVTEAPIPIRSLEQKALYLDPLDRVSRDGTTWQVMQVDHTVSPLRLDEDGQTVSDWRVNLTADATQEALAGADDPGPVTPPALHTVTLTYVSSKGATATLTSGGTGGGTDLGDLKVGILSGTKHRSSVDWSSQIVWPANTIRVVSASVRLTTAEAGSNPRIHVQRHTESWTEGGMTWGGPTSTTKDRRTINPSRVPGRDNTVSITAIAEHWRATGENHGLALRAVDEDYPDRYVAFYSDDASDSTTRPRLTIIVEVVA
jgi:hypothetical protein